MMRMHRYLCQHVPRGDYAGRGCCTLGENGACAEFRSFAHSSVILNQLRHQGWHVMVKGTVPGTFLDAKNMNRPEQILTFCPKHRPPSSVMALSESRT